MKLIFFYFLFFLRLNHIIGSNIKLIINFYFSKKKKTRMPNKNKITKSEIFFSSLLIDKFKCNPIM